MTVSPFKDGIDAIKEAGGATSSLCFQCGLCNTACPWNTVTNFRVRRSVRQAQFGLAEVEGEEAWRCTTCGNCVQRCPRGVEIIDIQTSLRRIASTWDILPKAVRGPKASLGASGNPLGEERQERADWAQDLSLNTFTEKAEVLYFPCCYLCYDSRLKNVAIATANILKKAKVDFGILGAEESCCGESIRKTGAEELYKRLAKENIKTFVDRGVKKILVSSPHCYQAFKNDYAEFQVNFEVVHMSQFLPQLIKEGKIELKKEYKKRVIYHDPCYLGRHNKIYDEPRQVLKKIPGLDLVEFADSRENSVCCGGGGGRIWMETPKQERFSDLKLRQAVEAGANVLATFCPYCILNFEASRLGLEDSEIIEIKDVTEVIQEATEQEG
ncbi:MAG: (Fe-S)-binding protein [Chloroflexi bacterium]|nr:(Fe-S)-binding protein [Chloroflexota bacterium]